MATVLPSLINLQYKEAKSHWRPLALNEVTIYNALVQRYNQVDQADFKAHYNNMPKIPHAYLMNKAATKYNRRISEQLWYLLPHRNSRLCRFSYSAERQEGDNQGSKHHKNTKEERKLEVVIPKYQRRKEIGS